MLICQDAIASARLTHSHINTFPHSFIVFQNESYPPSTGGTPSRRAGLRTWFRGRCRCRGRQLRDHKRNRKRRKRTFPFCYFLRFIFGCKNTTIFLYGKKYFAKVFTDEQRTADRFLSSLLLHGFFVPSLRLYQIHLKSLYPNMPKYL